jgi:SpoVK/Ycf46/Vps4 family AAA+-type ATPase
MNIANLLELLAEDPFDLLLRKQLAFAYADDAQHKKVIKQLQLISNERSLEDDEREIQAKALRALGFEDEAAAVEAQSFSSPESVTSVKDFPRKEDSSAAVDNPLEDLNSEEAPTLRVVHSNASKVAEVVPLRSPNKNVVRFSDIGGQEEVKKMLRLQIIEPFLRPELYNKFKKAAGGGVLLYGAPGCGKTMLAKAIAYECGAEFIPVRISDVLSRWIGESEGNLSNFFDKARSSKPSLLFFDELDALAFARSKASSDYSRTLVNEFLNQLDGVGFDNEGILFLAATNMPWDVDSAMKRPGRFSRLIFVPPPDVEARIAILESNLCGVPVEEINLKALAARLVHFSGADIAGLVDLAKEHALQDILQSGVERSIQAVDFDSVLDKLLPTTEDWLRTARNLVKYSGGDRSYQDVEEYLREQRFF